MRFLFIFCFSVLLSFNVNSFNPLKDVGDLVPGVGGIIKELGDAINEENKKEVKDKKEVQDEGNKKKIEKQQADQNKQQEEVNAIVEKHKSLRKQAEELNISDDLKTEVGKKDPFCNDQANKVYLISLTKNSKVREVVEANEILEKYIACKKEEEPIKIAEEKKKKEIEAKRIAKEKQERKAKLEAQRKAEEKNVGLSMFDETESEKAEFSMKCFDSHQGNWLTFEKVGDTIWRRVNNGPRVAPAKITEADDNARKYFAPLDSMIGKINVVLDFKKKVWMQKSAVSPAERYTCN